MKNAKKTKFFILHSSFYIDKSVLKKAFESYFFCNLARLIGLWSNGNKRLRLNLF